MHHLRGPRKSRDHERNSVPLRKDRSHNVGLSRVTAHHRPVLQVRPLLERAQSGPAATDPAGSRAFCWCPKARIPSAMPWRLLRRPAQQQMRWSGKRVWNEEAARDASRRTSLPSTTTRHQRSADDFNENAPTTKPIETKQGGRAQQRRRSGLTRSRQRVPGRCDRADSGSAGIDHGQTIERIGFMWLLDWPDSCCWSACWLIRPWCGARC